MKRFDDNSKKLIKNFVSLLTSAIVLVAATVAWFAYTGEPTEVGGMRGTVLKTNFTVTYYRLKEAERTGDLISVTTGTGSGAAFTLSTNPTYPDGFMPAGKWDSVSGALNINHLFPGHYDAFRMEIGEIEPRLIIANITCTDANAGALTAQQLETVYKNVYLYAVAVQTTTDSTQTPPVDSYSVMTTLASEDVIVCDSLYNLFSGVVGGVPASGFDVTAAQTITILDDADPALFAANDKSTILLFIGVPGDSVTVPTGQTAPDLVTEHEALRQIGAKLTLGSLAVSVN